jgi:phospho-N-acetylmuramoyl-pentapeptide-transferase
MRFQTIIISAAAALAVTAAAGFLLIPLLRALKAGQKILDIGPVWHKSKEGTPTMGGLMFISGICAVVGIMGSRAAAEGEPEHAYMLLFAMVYAAIGFLDDLAKLRKKRNLGLTARQKFFLQLAAAVFFVVVMRVSGNLTPRLFIPFVNASANVPEAVYLPLMAFIIVGCVNAVNITDGVDGLAAGTTLPVAVCFAAVALYAGNYAAGLTASSLAGGLAGFLIFNRHPAKIIMGDTGALFIGALVCALAFSMDMPLILVPLGAVYIVETLSDIVQITYFKYTKKRSPDGQGKRIFKMAPLHHHFEKCGWSENKVTAIFSGASAVFAVISYFAARQAFAR